MTTTETTVGAVIPRDELRRGLPVTFPSPHGTFTDGWVSSALDPVEVALCDGDKVRVRCGRCREHHYPYAIDLRRPAFRQVSVRVALRVPLDVTDEMLDAFVGTISAQVEEPQAPLGSDDPVEFSASDVSISMRVDGLPLSE